MSDIFESAALAFTLPHKQAQRYAVNLHRQVRRAADQYQNSRTTQPKLADIPEEFREDTILEGWHFDVKGAGQNRLYMTVEDGFEFADALGAFIHHLLRKFDTAGFVQFEWSRTCSRPEPTCFSGGAAHITADEIRFYTTSDWLSERSKTEHRLNRTCLA
jgi:hypothetical protein